MKKLTKEQWIGKCQLVHGDKYDYTESEYVDARTKTKIKCKKHNIVFEMTPDNHRRGEGCPICRYEKTAEKNRQTVEEFIKKATEIHNGKYDYSRIKYVNNRTKVEIVCPEHGVFSQRLLIFQRTLWFFLQVTPLIIICPIHGEFSQATNDHLHGQGCPHCKQSKIEKIVFDTLTESNITFETQYKYDESNHKNRLDFFIPSMGIGIECQGEQHFKPVDFANKGDEWANELFEKNLVRDKYKRELCENKGIKLLYYVPKKNTVPGYKSNKKFDGLYTNDNVCNNMEQLKKKIEGVSFDDI